MIKKQFYMGFAGLLGFMSLRCFYSGNTLDLWHLGFFAFFANFIIARISGSKEDERYIEDKKTAYAFAGKFAVILLFIIWCASAIVRNTDFLCASVSLAYAITQNVFAVKLYVLEER